VLIGLLVVGWKTAFAELGKEESFVKWLILVHTVAWILQFIGHGVFESNSANKKSGNLRYLTA